MALQKMLAPHGLAIAKVGEGFAVIEAPVIAPPIAPKPPQKQRFVTQKQPPPDLPEWPDELRVSPIVVTGYRTSNKASVREKRDSKQISDGVSLDTITLLPDLTTSDIARRIPGLSSIPEKGTETDRQIEGHQNVLIRGVDANYIQTTIDGLPFASANEDNRAPDLSLFPPTSIRRVEAIKTLTAADDPHGLTGRLNLQTMTAFDYDKPLWMLRASVGEDSTSGKILDDQGPNIRLDTLVTSRLGKQKSIGISFAASYEQFFSTSFDQRPGAESGSYLFYSPDETDNQRVDAYWASNGYASPARSQLFLFENSQERSSGLLKLEYEQGADLSLSLTGGLFHQTEKETRHESLVSVNRDLRPVDQTATSGTWLNGAIESGYVYQPKSTTTALLLSRLFYRFDDRSTINLAGVVSAARVDVKRDMSKFIRGMTADGIQKDDVFSYVLGPNGLQLDFLDTVGLNSPESYSSSYVRHITDDIGQDLFHMRGSYARPLDANGDWLLEFGGALTLRQQDFDRNYIEGDVFDTRGCTESDIRNCPLATFSAFVADRRFKMSDPYVDFLLVNDAAVRAVWKQQGMLLTNDRSDNSLDADYSLEEQVRGAYSRLIFDDDNWRFEIGLRLDDASSDVDYYLHDSSLTGTLDSAQYRLTKRSQSYSNLLPSFSARYKLSDNLVLRGAFSRTLGRPNIQDLTRGDTIGVPESGRVTITRGNPDLKPLMSDNFDISLEHYLPDDRGVLAASLFYKDVDDLIFPRRSLVDGYMLDGVPLIAEIVQPVNASGASLYGLELTANVQFDDLLPQSFGDVSVNANMTWTDSDFVYVNTDGEARDPGGWINQPKLIYNLQLSYENADFSANLAYNYVGEYLSNILAEDGDLYDTYAMSRGVTDLQLRYDLNDHFTLVGEVENLTAEDIVFNRRFAFGDLLATRAERGRVLWLGARVKY